MDNVCNVLLMTWKGKVDTRRKAALRYIGKQNGSSLSFVVTFLYSPRIKVNTMLLPRPECLCFLCFLSICSRKKE